MPTIPQAVPQAAYTAPAPVHTVQDNVQSARDQLSAAWLELGAAQAVIRVLEGQVGRERQQGP